MNLLFGAYLSSSVVSLCYNIYLTQRNHIKAKKNSKRKLKYRKDLNYRTKINLSCMNVENRYDLWDGIWHSFIPVGNVFYTYETIMFNEEEYKIREEEYDKIVEEANEVEDKVRKMNIDFLRSIRSSLVNLSSEDEEMINSDDSRISDKETKKILKLNGLNYDVEMLKYEKENDIQY